MYVCVCVCVCVEKTNTKKTCIALVIGTKVAGRLSFSARVPHTTKRPVNREHSHAAADDMRVAADLQPSSPVRTSNL
jgi:hypothetical protein